MGPPPNRRGALVAAAYGPVGAAFEASIGNWAVAAFVLAVSSGIAAYGAPSRRAETVLTAVMVLGFATVAVLGLAGGQIFGVIIGSVLAVVVGATCWHRRWNTSDSRVRTEELVGHTVEQATRLLGFRANRQPGGLRPPVLVAVPAADVDLTGAGLIVTAVTVDPNASTITFGVADGAGLTRGRAAYARYHCELVSRIGGFPADLRPLPARPAPAGLAGLRVPSVPAGERRT
ncbi:hypothetical protein [Tsukamurella strandjordii]|uniref:Uncharacterized protein n=2 Tax=Tsukamurellaceae TaxID=85028 RepID=A0AA90NEV6_9ACTN|nr:hypothetical protein [Tsukamurella strandjordii]MDP0397049.1 hypothetical protein [Tsukamurella strandjordii]GIZ96850.1 hypothetical protein TTY48_14620 [Tsukamurella sp. TY48]